KIDDIDTLLVNATGRIGRNGTGLSGCPGSQIGFKGDRTGVRAIGVRPLTVIEIDRFGRDGGIGERFPGTRSVMGALTGIFPVDPRARPLTPAIGAGANAVHGVRNLESGGSRSDGVIAIY